MKNKLHSISHNLGLHNVGGSILSISRALLMFLFSLLIGVFGFIIIEGYSLTDSIYMVVITFSTVGFGEVRPLSELGKLFASFYIFLNIGVFAYLLAVFSYYIVQGKIFKQLHIMHIHKRIKAMENHTILCGFGRYGKEITDHFIDHDIPFVIIEKDENVILEIQNDERNLTYVQGNATLDEVLYEAGIDRANGLLTALREDSANLYVILSARQINPKLDLISRADSKNAEKKLKLAGADHVIMPNQIGGFYMATLVSKPETIEFFSFLTNEFETDLGFEELNATNVPEKCIGLSIAEMDIRKESGANIIGYKTAGGKYVINPGPETVLELNGSFILIGNKEQLSKLQQYLDKY